ncbi:hypothetical protein ADL15_26985 [Actinoplanes awajinensis subsp. mycoplanecinus]|uniref:Uncharacterized protein n=1 Tax=Actinoplanes awajinensis subsp. mycoplanecinus TaxID=135947 RepID=A0A117MQ69_9ACTN|nr:hypothetical protein ADL15_26985 [Actinoplanes awajinensis subsp. mycoplanecinus]
MRADRQAVTEDPTVRRAHLLCDVNRPAEAATLATRVLAADPGNVDGWLVLARARILAGDPASALDAALTAGQFAPDLPDAHALTGAALADLERYAEAARAARDVIALDPRRSLGYELLADVLNASGENPAEALAAARTAVRFAPDWPTAHAALGTALAATDRRREAREAFRTALRLDPEHAPAHHGLALLAAQARNPIAAGQLAEAASGFVTVIRIDPGQRAGRDNLDRLLRVFLVRASYLLVVLGYPTARLAHDHPGAARTLALVAVAGPAAYTWRFLRRLGPDLRAYLGDVVSTARMRIVLAGSGTAVALLLTATALPAKATWLCTVVASIMAIAARVLLHFETKDQLYGPGQRTPYRLGTFTLVLIALLSSLVTLLLLAITISTGNIGGVSLSVALAALPVLCVRSLTRRSRRP